MERNENVLIVARTATGEKVLSTQVFPRGRAGTIRILGGLLLVVLFAGANRAHAGAVETAEPSSAAVSDSTQGQVSGSADSGQDDEAEETEKPQKKAAPTLRSDLWLSDYHDEAQRTVKLLQDAALRIQALRERSEGDLVVLDKLLKTNAESVDALSKVAEDIRLRMRDLLPLEERKPTEKEKKVGDQNLRQLVVLKDRAIALYQESAVFHAKLSVETKNNVVTRLPNVEEKSDETESVANDE